MSTSTEIQQKKIFREWFEDFTCGAVTQFRGEIQKMMEKRESRPAHLKGELMAAWYLSDNSRVFLGDAEKLDPAGGNFSRFAHYLREKSHQKFGAARRHLEDILKDHPDNPFLLDRLAEVQEREGDWNGALKTARQLHSLNPLSSAAHARYIQALYFVNRNQECLREFAAWQKKYPNAPLDPALQSVIGRALIKMGEFARAEKLLSHPPVNYRPLPDFDVVRERLPDPHFVEARLREKERRGETVEFHDEMNLGMSHLFTGNYKTALSLFQELKERWLAEGDPRADARAV